MVDIHMPLSLVIGKYWNVIVISSNIENMIVACEF